MPHNYNLRSTPAAPATNESDSDGEMQAPPQRAETSGQIRLLVYVLDSISYAHAVDASSATPLKIHFCGGSSERRSTVKMKLRPPRFGLA